MELKSREIFLISHGWKWTLWMKMIIWMNEIMVHEENHLNWTLATWMTFNIDQISLVDETIIIHVIDSINSFIFIHINKFHPLGRLYLYHYICHVMSMSLMSTFVNFIHVLWSLILHVSSTPSYVIEFDHVVQIHQCEQYHSSSQVHPNGIFFSFMQLIPILSHELHLCCCFDFIHVAIAFEWMSIFVHFIIFHVCGEFHHMMNSIL